MFIKFLKFIFVLAFLGAILAAGGVYLTYRHFAADLPSFEGLGDYHPPAASLVLSSDDEVLAEIYDERRYPVGIGAIPRHVINAFMAAEDAEFYNHPGIDFVSILRATYINLQQGSVQQGASTITQQVVKNLLLTKEKKFERKIKEAILAYRVENALTKDQIMELYLNQIYFGNTSYGIQAASKVYFHKPVGQITIAEAALLAGLPKAPSHYSPIVNPDLSRRRQKYVLRQMLRYNFITQEQADAARSEKIAIYPAVRRKYLKDGYYAVEVLRQFKQKFPDYKLEDDGLRITAAINHQAQTAAQLALRTGLKSLDKQRGWRGVIKTYPIGQFEQFRKDYPQVKAADLELGQTYQAIVTKSPAKKLRVLELGDLRVTVDVDQTWLRKNIQKNDRSRWVQPTQEINPGDVVEISFTELPDLKDYKSGDLIEVSVQQAIIDQSPQLEGAVVLLDPHNGEVLSLVGGYSFAQSVFNRATQSLRQPGSAFKPILYLTAIDAFNYTPSTLVSDSPRSFRAGTQWWTPKNYDKKYMGSIPLRLALEKSRNLVSADIISKIGVKPVIEYARKLGIESKLGENLSLSLGSSEVTPLEITRAFGVFPAGGKLHPSIIIKKVEDRFGQVVFEAETENEAAQVIRPESAFIMSNLLQGVVQHGTGYKIKALNRPAGGKTGTSNDQMDAWFVGFTPELACGVWVGFDQKRTIGARATGGSAAGPIWLETMQTFLDQRDQKKAVGLQVALDKEAEQLGIEKKKISPEIPAVFVPPAEGLDSYWVDRRTGRRASEGASGAILEYFISGTEPVAPVVVYETTEDYWESDEF